MNVTVFCTNHECDLYEQDRTITLPVLTAEVVMKPPLHCGRCEAPYELAIRE